MGIFLVFSGRPAHAAEGPLLVVVEAPPALDADAAEIRRAIGTELHARTIAPMKTTSEPPRRALIVAIDHERIAMSLRTGDGTSRLRGHPGTADRAARLRAIAWLAGNLARDQVSPILRGGTGRNNAIGDRSVDRARPATEPPPLPSPTATAAVSAPPVAPTARRDHRDDRDNRSARKPDWSPSVVITFAGGPTANISKDRTSGLREPPGISTFNDARERMGFCWAPRSRGSTAISLPRVLGCWYSRALRAATHWSFEGTVGAGVELGQEASVHLSWPREHGLAGRAAEAASK